MSPKLKQNDDIDSNAIFSIRGMDFQKLRVINRLLDSLINDETGIMCTIEYIDDVLKMNTDCDNVKYTAEQDKLYTSPFSLNSIEIKKALRIFFDNWINIYEESESINFVFYTNTSVSKEKNVGLLEKMVLPENPILQLLIEKKYEIALPFIKTVLSDFYIDEHKKKAIEIEPYKKNIDNMTDEKWMKFLNLIEWNFGENGAVDTLNEINLKVNELILKYNISENLKNDILCQIVGLVSLKTFENDFLKKMVHMAEVKNIFLEKVRDVEVNHVLAIDPIYDKWDKIDCNDIRNFDEKIYSVCADFDEIELENLNDDCIDGIFEQDHCSDVKKVKAFKYRIYKVCQRIVEREIRKMNNNFDMNKIISTIEYMTKEAYEVILDKSKTYEVPFKDKDMVKKTIIILFSECYLAFDKGSVINE